MMWPYWPLPERELRRLFRKSGSWLATFTISGRIPELPPAFSFLSLPTSSDGSFASCGFIGLCLILSSSTCLNWLSTFKMPLKCRLHRCCLASIDWDVGLSFFIFDCTISLRNQPPAGLLRVADRFPNFLPSKSLLLCYICLLRSQASFTSLTALRVSCWDFTNFW